MKPMRNRTNIISQCLSLTTLGLLCASNASAAVVTFVGAGSVDPYHVAGNWTGVVGGDGIPTSADDAIATGRFQLNDGSTRELNSLTVNGGGSFIGDGLLNVTDDVLINSNLQLQGSGNLQWGGLATLGNGVGSDLFEVVFGTHTDPSRVVGNNLDVTSSGLIKERWYTLPTVAATVPDFDLSGTLTFAAGSIFEIKLENTNVGIEIDNGAYFLIGSDDISGPLPTLNLTNFEADQEANSFLSFDTTNADVSLQGLYLTVAVPEPSSAALIGLGGFALILRRRR